MTTTSRRALSVAVAVLVAAIASYAQTDTTRKDAQAAAAEAARLLTQTEETKVVPPKPDYWTRSLMTNVNFIQNSFTNWAKGGYNNYALSAYIDGKADWKKDEMYWNNRLQLDYGFLYSDDKPLMQKNKDRILLESTWGYKATKTLSYTAKFTFLNQFTSGWTYPTPSVEDGEEPTSQQWKDARVLKSSFCAPAIVTLGLGVDWIPTKWLTVNFAPLTGGFTIVRAEQLRKTYGMLLREDGLDPAVGSNYRSAKFQFGAQVKADAKFVINEVFTYGTQVVIFTDYLDNPFREYRVNWDNKITWNVGKYFKIGLDTWFIYDPNVIIKNDKDIAQYPEGRARGQFKEFTSFNFAYTLKPRRLRDTK